MRGRMKMKKKIIIIKIIFIMIFTMFSGIMLNYSYAAIRTPSEIKNKINNLKNTPGFMEGEEFKGSFAGAEQCHGWALKVTNELFGSNRNGNYNLWTDIAYPNVTADDLCIGDIVRYPVPKYKYDHSIVIIDIQGDTVYYADCNWGENCYSAVHPINGNSICWNRSTTKAQINAKLNASNCFEYGHQNQKGRIIHHIQNDVKSLKDVFVPDGSKQDIGTDFTAYITPKSNSKLAVQVAGIGNGANVNLTTRNENSQSQKWYFQRQSDGSYSIKNLYSGNYLDIENSGNIDHENVQVWSGGTGDKQCWFIYSYNGGYRLVPRSSAQDLKSLDIGDDIKDGANLQIYQAVSNNNAWQTFNIIRNMGEKQNIGTEFTASIVPKTNSKLAVKTVGTDNGSNVQLGTRANEESQKWIFKRQSDGSYSIKNKSAGKYLDIYNTGDTNHENVQIWSGGTGDKQSWFIYSYNGGYRLVPKSSPEDLKALDIGDSIKDGANLQIYYFVSNSNSWQTFNIIKDLGEIQDIGNEFTASIVPKSKLNLALEAVGTDNGSNVQLETKSDEDSQKWIFKKQSDGSYSIKNKNSDKYLDIYNTGNENGENVQIWSGGSGDKQCWFIYLYNGGYKLVPRSSKLELKSLDIDTSTSEIKAGSKLQIYDNWSSENASQTFDIINDYKKGDVNGDGIINIKDWNKLYSYINKTVALSSDELQRADVNEDGIVNIKDLNRLYQHITKVNLIV